MAQPARREVSEPRHDPQKRLFYIEDKETGAICSFVEYQVDWYRNTIDLQHTVSKPEYRGYGLAGKVVRKAFEAASKLGLRVVPTCSYIATFVKRKPEWAYLVYEEPGSASTAGTKRKQPPSDRDSKTSLKVRNRLENVVGAVPLDDFIAVGGAGAARGLGRISLGLLIATQLIEAGQAPSEAITTAEAVTGTKGRLSKAMNAAKAAQVQTPAQKPSSQGPQGAL